MKIQEIVSSCIMFVVSALVLIGFTIAWYSGASSVVTGFAMEAVGMGEVKVALTSGGADISELSGDAMYAELGMPEFTNVDTGEFAPGAYGKVTFFVTPINSIVTNCDIVPTVLITQDGSIWYSEEAESDVSAGDGEAGDTVSDNDATIGNLADIAGRHIQFFADEDMTVPVSADEPFQLKWTQEDAAEEKTAVLYWKWYYEYPFSTEELTGEAALSEAEQKQKLRQYDEEDMLLGNNVSEMKFHFTFSAR